MRWKIQGRPNEGYSSTVFPPPHYDPISRKRNKPQQIKAQPKKPKVKKKESIPKLEPETKKVQDQEIKTAPLTVEQGICANCKTTDTPLWRRGPLGTRT